ncbi:MAG: hypothetical protein IJX57_04365 [Clostridia bacterium]|nr:hypothetical protein [Clostridia bacterium]
MKKLSALFVMLMLMIWAGVCAHAADFTVESVYLPDGNAYEPYSAQIQMENGNSGYTFEFVSGFKPIGLTINSDGTVTGTPTSSGNYTCMTVRISHTDGTSAEVDFAVLIMPRKIKVNIDAPYNAVYDGVTEYTADVTFYDMNGNVLTDITPTVKYGADRLPSAVDAGTYYIRVSTPSGCSIRQKTGDEYLYVKGAEVTELSVIDKTFEYDGQPHGITAADVTVNPSNAGWAVEYKKNGSSYYTTETPVDAGTYQVRVYTTNSNYLAATATATLVIDGSTVDFAVENTTFEYDGNVHTVTVTPSIENIGYTVSYIDEEGNTVANPVNAGKYKVKITLTEAGEFSVGTVTNDTLTITKKTVDFIIADNVIDYDGQVHTPVVTTDPAIADSEYTVKYYKQGTTELVDTITNAGVYNVSITFAEDNYTIGASSTQTVTINPITINFTVSDNEIDYDGNYHTATITPDKTIASSDYAVTYVNQGVSYTSVKKAGVYDITITFPNGNYILADGFDETMTINAELYLNLGNSPAAMIYKDADHANDTAWQEAALGELKTNRKFGSYVPGGCDASIIYNVINSIDLDGDANTLIVKDIDSFNDPGMVINDGMLNGPVTGTLTAVDGVEGLYQITYTYGDVTKTRYVMEAGNKIGDVNADTHVNAVDANHLAGQNKTADGVIESRVHDVNKDGTLDENDAEAIRNRFKTPLVPYYPWIQK